MTETETPLVPKAPRKARRKRRRAAVVAPKEPKKPDIFAGLSASECPLECNAQGCVITGRPRCGHPRKGGLQGTEMHDFAVVERFAEASKRLAHAEIDKKAKRG